MSTCPTHCPHCGERIAPEPKKRAWTPGEDAILLEMLQAASCHLDIATRIGRPVTSIRSRINTLARIKTMDANAPRANDDQAKPPSAVTVRPGVRIITHRLRG